MKQAIISYLLLKFEVPKFSLRGGEILVGSVSGSSMPNQLSYLTKNAPVKNSNSSSSASAEANESPAEKLAEATGSKSSTSKIDTYAWLKSDRTGCHGVPSDLFTLKIQQQFHGYAIIVSADINLKTTFEALYENIFQTQNSSISSSICTNSGISLRLQ